MQIKLVVRMAQVGIDNLAVMFLSAVRDVVQLHIFCVHFVVLELVRLCVFLQTQLAHLEQYAVHELHTLLELWESLIE